MFWVVTNFITLKDSQEKLYDDVHIKNLSDLPHIDCNSTVNRIYLRLFSKYVPENIAVLKIIFYEKRVGVLAF